MKHLDNFLLFVWEYPEFCAAFVVIALIVFAAVKFWFGSDL